MSWGWLVCLLGVVTILAILSKAGLSRVGLPPVVGYLVLGFLLRVAAVRWNLLSAEEQGIFQFLAELGIACLLFRVGLQSNFAGLLGQLRRAIVVWLGDFTISGTIGFVAAYFVLGLELPTSLVIAIALTATSVGVSVATWQSSGNLQSPAGQLLVDVAELDDISGIVAMSMLFSLLPVIHDGSHDGLLPQLLRTAGLFTLSLGGFATVCYGFSRYAEERLTRFFVRMGSASDRMLLVVSTGFIIASLAAWLGFSIAIGSFFAGLLFSRDPQSVRIDASFDAVYELLMPFFFIGIGLNIVPSSLGLAAGLGAVLLVAAILGKLLGNGLPILLTLGKTSAAVIGVSMLPRAEIAMVVMSQGLRLGDWAVPPRVYGAMVLVSATTCVLSPLAANVLLRRWPQPQIDESSGKS